MGLNIGSRRELFVDHLLIDRLENTHLRLHEPVSGGVAIRIDRPWEGAANFGISVIQHQGRYLMYYRAMKMDEDFGRICVALSEDGVVWTKPALIASTPAGHQGVNFVVDDAGAARFSFPNAPWLDTRPGIPADEQVKVLSIELVSGERYTAMVDPEGAKRMVFWGSADGFTFHKLDPQPELVSHLRNCFDGGTTMFWSEAEQQYVLYYRWYDGEWGQGYRSMARTTSKDLLQWTESVPMSYGDTTRDEFYINNTQPYFRAPHLYVAPAARFMPGRRVVTDEQVQAIGLKAMPGHFYGNDCSDGVLLTSRAGSVRYDRTFMETFVRPGLGASNWVSRANFPLTGIFPYGAERIMLFVARHYMQETWHVERMFLRTDGFASVAAPWAGGEMVTKSLTFTGRELELNYRTGAAGFVRVEIQDVDGVPIPGYTLADCPEIIGDEIARVVAWKQGPEVSQLAGQSVRLRFVMKDADLFAMKFFGSRD